MRNKMEERRRSVISGKRQNMQRQRKKRIRHGDDGFDRRIFRQRLSSFGLKNRIECMEIKEK
jgi:hypothetical protein